MSTEVRQYLAKWLDGYKRMIADLIERSNEEL
jgi:hypothetical protein